MMRDKGMRIMASVAVLAAAASGCSDWRGLNSIPLPGVQGTGPGAFTIQAQMPKGATPSR